MGLVIYLFLLYTVRSYIIKNWSDTFPIETISKISSRAPFGWRLHQLHATRGRTRSASTA